MLIIILCMSAYIKTFNKLLHIEISQNQSSYTLTQYKIFQKCMALYMLFHFMSLIFSVHQLLSTFETLICSVILICALFIFFNIKPRLVAFMGWLFCALFCYKNLALYGLNHDYIGWLLLAMTTIKIHNKQIEFPRIIYVAAWMILAVGYLASGVNKLLLTDFWMNGSALETLYAHSPVFLKYRLLDNSIAQILLKYLTWLFVGFELFFIALLFNKYTKLVAYIFMTVTHLFIASTTQMTEVSFSVLIFHLFVFDSRWLHRKYWITNET